MIRFSDDKPDAPKAAKPAAKPAAPNPAAEPRTTFDLNGRSMSVPGEWSEADLAPFLKAVGGGKVNAKAVGKTKVGRHLQTTLGDPAAFTAELATFAEAAGA